MNTGRLICFLRSVSRRGRCACLPQRPLQERLWRKKVLCLLKLTLHKTVQRSKIIVSGITLITIIFFTQAIGHAGAKSSSTSVIDKNINDIFSYKAIPSTDGTWGYNIYINQKLAIHQPNIPGRPGKAGFKTKEAAQKVAELVIEKLKKGEMPPTITEEELKKLNAI